MSIMETGGPWGGSENGEAAREITIHVQRTEGIGFTLYTSSSSDLSWLVPYQFLSGHSFTKMSWFSLNGVYALLGHLNLRCPGVNNCTQHSFVYGDTNT